MNKLYGDKINLIDYMTEACPSCKKISPYLPNPIYMHKCQNEGCSFEGYESDLISIINDIQLEEDILKLRKEITNSEKKLFSEIKNEN